MMLKTLCTAAALFCSLQSYAAASHPDSTALHQALSQKDAEFFQRGFNQCELSYLDANISENLRFYHDQSGVQDKKLFMQNTRQYLCSDPLHKPIRQLTAGSLRTFPLYQNGVLYGAIQHGSHEFYLREPGKTDRLTGTARFTSVWLKHGDNWLLSDVLSYDHQPAPAQAAAAGPNTKHQPESVPAIDASAEPSAPE